MLLSDIKIVDLRRSEVDEVKSNPKKGKYVFKAGKKVYVEYRNPAFRPPHYIKWNRNTDYDIESWKINWNYSFVTAKDPYWPEGLKPNQEGRYVFKTDMVLMKCPMADHVKKAIREMEKSELASAAIRKEFREKAKRMGVEAFDEKMNQRIFGRDA